MSGHHEASVGPEDIPGREPYRGGAEPTDHGASPGQSEDYPSATAGDASPGPDETDAR